jgi:hypothetical protein
LGEEAQGDFRRRGERRLRICSGGFPRPAQLELATN